MPASPTVCYAYLAYSEMVVRRSQTHASKRIPEVMPFVNEFAAIVTPGVMPSSSHCPMLLSGSTKWFVCIEYVAWQPPRSTPHRFLVVSHRRVTAARW